jgi:alpha-D-xyloside xylohydrolase
MRFGDGAWRMLPGVVPTYLARLDGVDRSQTELLLHVSSRPEKERWATLQGDMFSVRISSPADDVLRVQVSHHQGRVRRGPHFELDTSARPLTVSESADGFVVVSGNLELRLSKEPWGMTFVDRVSGEPITSSPHKALGLMDKPGAGLFLREQLTLRAGELVYGLGERFSAFAKNGQAIDMWNADCGTCSDKGYKDVPFFLSSRGYGVLVNSPAKVSFEIGTEQVMRAQFAAPGEELDYFFIHGPEPKQVLERLGALSGRPALPPVWSFGLWLSTSFTTDYDEQTVTSFIDGMRQRDIPLHVFHFDCFWMKRHHWCNFEWDADVFPDAPGMLARLKQKGLRVCVWINPYLGERSHLFAEGAERSYLLKRPNGDVYQRNHWQAGMGLVDFTNPEAVGWFQSKLRSLLDMGVDAFKTDFGEEIPTDVVYHDGSDPERMHNYYTFLYNRAVFELLERTRGPHEAAVFARSATATCQQFPVHWGGDCYGNYESMAESLRGGLSLALCGFGFWSHDIGGFESKASAAVYKRWVAFGLLSSHSRLHGSTSYRVPWTYDDEAVDVVRYFTQLKCRLMPYLMRAAVQAHRSSAPMMRAMLLEFPQDPTCRTLDRQYMLGDDLLVAPLFHDSRAEYYLPEGQWTHLLSGETRPGGRWYFDELDFFSVPLWVRENALIPLGPELTQVDYDFAGSVRLVAGKLSNSTREIEIFDRNAVRISSFSVEHQQQTLTVVNLQGRSDFELQLPWAKEIVELDGGEQVMVASAGRVPGTAGGVVVKATRARITLSWN